jgi:chemotaxis protein histidine kinase CheA
MNDIFEERMAAVRQRFVAKLDARIDEIDLAIPQLGREGGLDALKVVHRNAHGLCGIGPTLGFVETGKAARSIERLLLVAVKAERTLTADETTRVREGVALLRSTATAETGRAAQV